MKKLTIVFFFVYFLVLSEVYSATESKSAYIKPDSIQSFNEWASELDNELNELNENRRSQLSIGLWSGKLRVYKKEGNFKTYHKNDNLEIEGYFKNGKPEGLFKEYYKNGKLRDEGNFKNGKLDGLAKTCYSNGNLFAEENYEDGKQNGRGKSYYKSGNLQIEANFKDGKLEGLLTGYYENGDLKVELTYKDGIAISGYLYDENGKKTKMTNAHLYNLLKGTGLTPN